MPESFNVLVNELKALALNVELMESDILTDQLDEDGAVVSDSTPSGPVVSGGGGGEQAH